MMRTPVLSIVWIGICLLSAAMPASGATFEIVKVSDALTDYATFHSHNQKIVQNAYGIFMTYTYNEAESGSNDPETPYSWRLARSIDGGKSWRTIYQANVHTKPPILETDERGSIFLIHSNFASDHGDATFYRFDPENAYGTPAVVRAIPNGSAGKYTSYYDRGRKRIYYVNFWDCQSDLLCTSPNFHVLDRDGNILLIRGLTVPGNFTDVQYPHLEMNDSTLYFAWTTADAGGIYREIFYAFSEDGGDIWKATSAKVLNVPFASGSPSEAIRVSQESNAYPWLSSFIFKGGHLHFAYASQSASSNYTHPYVRISPNDGQRCSTCAPAWTGSSYELGTQRDGGFFASESADTTSLFAIGPMGSHLAVLKSDNLGVDWQDHQISSTAVRPAYKPYAISGNRQLTKTGHILGHFTQAAISPGDIGARSVWFFRVPAVDRSTDPYKDWKFLPIDVTNAQHDSGFAYTIPLDIPHGADSLQNGTYSKLRLFEIGIENGVEERVEIGPAHSLHAVIRSSGGGRFSHWGGSLYFSSTENQDPRNAGKKYEVAVPWTETSGPVMYGRVNPAAIRHEQGNAFTVTQDFGTAADTPSAQTVSKLRLYEDGAPLGAPHSQHADIRATGQGLYSHWSGTLYFASSDNTDPRTNGRSYTWAIEGSAAVPCATLHLDAVQSDGGYAYKLPRAFGSLPSDTPSNYASPVRLFENGVELGAAHATHDEIRNLGGGRFSDWNNGSLYFSTSDNTDPRTNNRIYSWGSATTCPSL